jgi:hypothetical protein
MSLHIHHLSETAVGAIGGRKGAPSGLVRPALIEAGRGESHLIAGQKDFVSWRGKEFGKTTYRGELSPMKVN